MAGNVLFRYNVVDINSKTRALTGNDSMLVRYFSTAAAYMNALPDVVLNLDTCIIRNGSETVYGMNAEFENVESDEFIFSAEDSAGNVYRVSHLHDMVDYVKLTCNVWSSRPDASGEINLTCTGDYFCGSFGAQENTLTLTCKYKKSGSASWSDGGTVYASTYPNNQYVATKNISGLDYEASYDFMFIAVDRLMTVDASLTNVRSLPIFHWGENDMTFEVPVKINGKADITGDLRLKGSGNYGNTLYFGDSSYCYISEATDDVMTINANKVNIQATGGFTVNGSAVGSGGGSSGTWTPTLTSGIVQYYDEQAGWYTKIGNVVTIGFRLKATCNSGFTATSIKIYGLPYTPAYAAAGGGMCSGAYMNSNKNFQCFVAETSGQITTRVQACDSVSGTDLTTSADGCKYPSTSGGVVTLSGTITFTI
jgi:hypothetical protein